MRLVTCVLIGLALGCTSEKTRREKLEELRAMPAHALESWRDFSGRGLGQELRSAPAMVVELLAADNAYIGYDARPRAAEPTAELQLAFRNAIAELPDSVRRLADPKLVGVFVVHELGSTAFSDVIRDERRAPVAGFIVLDADRFTETNANDWFTWKENTAFAPDDDTRIVGVIEPPERNDVTHALQFLVLHELGHIVAINDSRVASADGPRQPARNYAFTRLSWSTIDQPFVSLFDSAFLWRPRIRYYGPERTRIRSSKAMDVYGQLLETNFPTPYSATAPADDFADSFATYIHTELMRRPYELTAQNGAMSVTIGSCWRETRCAEKRRILEQMLGAP